jgi:hypothetical protein
MSYPSPGQTDIIESQEIALFASGPDNNHRKFTTRGVIDSTVTDSGNTAKTTTIRGGTVMAVKTSDGNLYRYDADATDGTQAPVGILGEYTNMLNRDGTAVDKTVNLFTGGILKNTSDVVLVDKAALAVLLRIGFKTADLAPHGSHFLLHPKARYFKAADYTLTDADHGCMFVATAACNFTLPDLATVGKGYSVLLFNGANTDMVVTGAANTIVYGDSGGALSTTLTFSTANKKMGGQVLMLADYASDGGSLVWYPLMCTTTITSA